MVAVLDVGVAGLIAVRASPFAVFAAGHAPRRIEKISASLGAATSLVVLRTGGFLVDAECGASPTEPSCRKT
jgi:branched-subunit amino acid transport protein AzlD